MYEKDRITDKHYAASWFVQLPNSNVYSWSNVEVKIQIKIFAGEMAHFCLSFTLGK